MLMDLPPQQVFCIAQVIYAEARGEPVAGQRAVGHVVINRSKKTGKPACTIIKEPGQFQVRFKKSYKGKDWDKAYSIASNLGSDNTAGARYFKSRRLGSSWGKLRITTSIGGHNFYK